MERTPLVYLILNLDQPMNKSYKNKHLVSLTLEPMESIFYIMKVSHLTYFFTKCLLIVDSKIIFAQMTLDIITYIVDNFHMSLGNMNSHLFPKFTY